MIVTEKEEIVSVIETDDLFCVGALMRLSEFQTEDEFRMEGTAFNNSVGFNGPDAPFCTSVAKQVLSKNAVTEGQLVYLRKILPKYAGQLSLHGGVSRAEGVEVRKKSTVVNRKEATPTGHEIELRFSYDPTLVTAVKALPDRRARKDGTEWVWVVPDIPNVRVRLKELGFDIGLESEGFGWEDASGLVIPGLRGTPYEYQKQGILFLEKNKGNGIIGDEMGLGKTIQAIGYMQLHPETRPVLIVCPASLKDNWARECKKWMDGSDKIALARGKRPPNGQCGFSILIINYDIIADWQEWLVETYKPELVIIDEFQRIKNMKAKRTKATLAIGRVCEHVVGLSGTPIINRPIEFFPMLHLVDPKGFAKWWPYAQRYCGLHHNGFGYVATGATNTQELHALVNGRLMIRRKKSEVLTQLPPKTRSVVPLEIDNRNEYSDCVNNFKEWLAANVEDGKLKATKAAAITQIEYLKQTAAKGKLGAAMELVEDFLDTGEKLVLFATHHSVIDAVMDKFKGCAVSIDGRVPVPKRQAIVDAFQKDEKVRLFVGNIEAAGEGITLTASSTVAFLELGWSPGKHTQAEDRVHRIGQIAESINIYYYVGLNTIEEDIMRLLDEKAKVLAQVLDGEDVQEEALLTSLLKKQLGEL